MVKWNPSDGFGFHLLADKKRKGQFIGKVDPGSAAEAAGLKQGDRIVEVNGHNVTNESHKEVVQRIKSLPNETQLLVIDPHGQLYYAERNIAINSGMPNVMAMKTPARTPASNNKPAKVEADASSKLRSSLKVLYTVYDLWRTNKLKVFGRTSARLRRRVSVTSSNGELTLATASICWLIKSAQVTTSMVIIIIVSH